jgi:hypothetical protein
MSVQFVPLSGCQRDALQMQTALANSVISLFKSSLAPTPSTSKAEYEAMEADYDDYAPITMSTWHDPILAPGSGYMIGSPLVQFEVGDTDPTTPNLIGGCWVEDATGHVRLAVIFTAPVPMQVAGQGIPINLIELFPTNF